MAHSPRIGKLPEFRPDNGDSMSTFVEILDAWLELNEVTEKRNLVLISALDTGTYDVLRNIVSPRKPTEMEYSDLVKALEGHFNPTPITVGERFKFWKRDQKDGESVKDYALELRKLSRCCEFGQFLDEALRDKLVCGLKNESFQKRLLSEPKMDFAQALNLAQALEQAASQAASFHDQAGQAETGSGQGVSSSEVPVNRVFSQAKRVTMKPRQCWRCGRAGHFPSVCRFKDARCHKCGKAGHIKPVCSVVNVVQANTVDKESDVNISDEQDAVMYINDVAVSADVNRLSPYMVEMRVQGSPLEMEVDTGASVSLVPKHVYDQCLNSMPLEPVRGIVLKGYSGSNIPILGKVTPVVEHNGQKQVLSLLVVDCADRPCLLGRDWLARLRLDWPTIVGKVTQVDSTPDIKAEFHDLFGAELGDILGMEASVELEDGATPKFHRCRPVPFSLHDKVIAELDRQVAEGELTPVEHSSWASPLVVVPKGEGVRLCADFKVTINQHVKTPAYPLPTPEEIFAKLAGGESFSKLDLSRAYKQLRVSKESQHLLTVNTPKGLMQYTRLPYGIVSAPSIWQRTMDEMLQGLDGVVAYLDDVLVTGRTREEHIRNLEAVLRRFRKFGVRLAEQKCSFFQKKVVYLGMQVSKDGLKPTDERVQSILSAPRPESKEALRSFLGMLTFNARFIPNLSSVVQPLYELIKDATPWSWSGACEKAFQEAKRLMAKVTVAAHYDVSLPVRLYCDASSVGVGACLTHVYPDGTERPVAYASQVLSSSQRNYAQLEREAYAIIFAVKRFHMYLFGRSFVLVTDHQPLCKILGPKEAVPPLAAARLQRWALILGAYDYKLEHVSGKRNTNADCMSRLPASPAQEDEKIFFHCLEDLPLTGKEIAEATRRDPVLNSVLRYTVGGWPDQVNNELRPFHVRRNELTVEQGCVLWGLRVLIPTEYRERLLMDLHAEHPGMGRMKALARGFLWWPGLDQDVEQLVRECVACQSVRQVPPVAPVHPYKWPERPWARIHIDFAEKDRQSFLLVHDSHSKWLEVVHCPDTTAARTVSILRSLFARYGLPETIVSDNGPQFVSEDFQRFLKCNGVRHVLTPPYHPASNGAAERAVRILKESLVKQLATMEQSGRYQTLQHRLDNFLLGYRSTPHSVTGRSPAEMFLGRRVRTKLSLLLPQVRDTVERSQERQMRPREGVILREFTPQQKVNVRNYRGREKWVPGTVLSRKGTLTYVVSVAGGTRFVHLDQLVARSEGQSKPAPGRSDWAMGQPELLPGHSESASVVPPLAFTAPSPSPANNTAPLESPTGDPGGLKTPGSQDGVAQLPRRSVRMTKGVPAKRLGFDE